MDLSKIPPGMVGQVAGMVADYITGSRKKYAANAQPLTAVQRAAMQPFFPPEILAKTTLLVLNGEQCVRIGATLFGQQRAIVCGGG